MQPVIRFLAAIAMAAALAGPGAVALRSSAAAAVAPAAQVVPASRAGTWPRLDAAGVRIADESTEVEEPVEADPTNPDLDEPAPSEPEGAEEGSGPPAPEEGSTPPGPDEGSSPDQSAPPAEAPPPADQSLDGSALFLANCSICHGRQGEGRVGPRLAGTQLSLEQVLQQVRTPRNLMPPFSSEMLSDAQVAAIYAYLQSLGTE